MHISHTLLIVYLYRLYSQSSFVAVNVQPPMQTIYVCNGSIRKCMEEYSHNLWFHLWLKISARAIMISDFISWFQISSLISDFNYDFSLQRMRFHECQTPQPYQVGNMQPWQLKMNCVLTALRHVISGHSVCRLIWKSLALDKVYGSIQKYPEPLVVGYLRILHIIFHCMYKFSLFKFHDSIPITQACELLSFVLF